MATKGTNLAYGEFLFNDSFILKILGFPEELELELEYCPMFIDFGKFQ